MTNNTEIYHHGVKGQRWGVRRYQNQDGSLTPKGREKLDKLKEKSTAEIERRRAQHENQFNKEKDKLTKKFVKTAEKAKDPANNKKVQRLVKEMHISAAKHAAAKKQFEKELKVVKDYSLDDFKKERKYVAGKAATQIAVTALTAATLAAVTGAYTGTAVIAVSASGSNAQAYKRDYRNDIYKKRYGGD